MKQNYSPIIRIDKETIYKRMKISKNSKMYNTIDKIFDKCLQIVIDKTDLQTMFLTKENLFHFDIKDVDSCEKIAFCFATTGSEISDLINKYFIDDNYLEGYLLNEIANEIVMDATSQMYEYIKNEVKKQDYHLTKRFSPGECSFKMEYQATILEELKKDFQIKATLTEFFMIDPEKSTLFIYGIDKNIPELKVDFNCNSCESVNCTYKRTV